MTTMTIMGGRRASRAQRWLCAAALTIASGCTTLPQNDPAPADGMAELEMRLRLVQTELAMLRSTLAQRDAERDERRDESRALAQSLASLRAGLDELPARLESLCPDPPAAATVNAQCEPGPDAQRVVVSGDKLVLGQVERVWLAPPQAFLEARIDPGSESSALDVAEVVEFERDGSKWVRFDLALEDGTATVERALKRYVRLPGVSGAAGRRPAVDLRVQIGDVREQVEVVLTELDGDEPLRLGRNFLTDVALVDVARHHVQPAFRAPE